MQHGESRGAQLFAGAPAVLLELPEGLQLGLHAQAVAVDLLHEQVVGPALALVGARGFLQFPVQGFDGASHLLFLQLLEGCLDGTGELLHQRLVELGLPVFGQ